MENHLNDFLFETTIKTIENMYEQIINIYDYVDIIGFSMGGALASYLASKGRFRKVILLSPSNIYINWKLPAKRAKILFDYYSHRKNSLSEIDMKKLKYDDKKSLNLLLNDLIPNYTINAIKTFRKIIKYCNLNLKRISSPTLILWGNVDQLVPFSSIKYVSGFCDNVQIKILENISHLMLNSINNKIIINEICYFLDE